MIAIIKEKTKNKIKNNRPRVLINMRNETLIFDDQSQHKTCWGAY